MDTAYTATPALNAPAVAFAVLPSLAFVVALEISPLLPSGSLSALAGETGETVRALKLLSSGFIVTAVLWGAAAAALIDRRFRQSAAYLFVGSLLCLFGVIHSPAAQGTLFLPWHAGSTIPFHLAAAYATLGVLFLAASFAAPSALEEPVPERRQ